MVSSHSKVKLAGISNVGGVVSSIVMTCVTHDALPHSSVAVNVRVSTNPTPQLPSSWVSCTVTVTWLQLSVASAISSTTLSEHERTWSSGMLVNSGAVVSSTTIV